MGALASAARAQIRRAEALGKSLDLRLAAKIKASPDWVPDEEWRKDFQSVTQTIQQAGQSLIRALEGNKKDLGNLTDEQLLAQFKAEMKTAVKSMTPEEWQALVDARNKQ